MSIRFQLLIVALATLVLPWAGCQYARELETALRVAQENALLASADTIARALSAEPSRVFAQTDDEGFKAAQGDIYVFPLQVEPLLDGYREDWDAPPDLTPLASSDGLAARLQAATSSKRPVILRVETDAGHGIGSTRKQRDDETADTYAFILWQTGDPRFQPMG